MIRISMRLFSVTAAAKCCRVPCALFVSALMLSSFSYSQQLLFKNYTRSNGLASDYVLCIYQDREGFIWFGTDRGVSRYDGREFVNFTTSDGLSSNFIYTIFQDSRGAMWFGTYEGGVTRFDGNTFRALTAEEGFPLRSTYSIAEDADGRMYFVSDDATIMMDAGKVHSERLPSGAGYFLRTRRGSFLRFASSQVETISIGTDSRIHLQPIITLQKGQMAGRTPIESQDGSILFGIEGNVCRLSFKNQSWRFAAVDTIGTPPVAIAEDARGAVWVATAGNGLYRLNGKTKTRFTTKQGLARNRIESLLVDYEGNLWVGTFGGGAQKLLSDDITIYKEADGLAANDVTKIFLDSRKRIWAGTERGVSVIDGQRVVQVAQVKEARGFAEDAQGRVYVGNLNGLFGPYSLSDWLTARKPRYRQIGYGISGLRMRGGVNAETLWIGTYGFGVHRLIADSLRRFDISDGLKSEMSEDVVRGSGGVWFLSRTVGASRYRDGRFESFSIEQGLPSNTVHCVLENHNGVWFGTNRGVAYKVGARIDVINEADGLKGNNVSSIFKTKNYSDENPSLWILTDKALHRYEQGKLIVYGSIAGFLSSESRVNYACFDDSTEILWLATTSGVVKLDVSRLEQVRVAPKVVITTMSADTITFAGASARNFASTPLQLHYSQTNISIGYAGLSFADEKSVRYKMRLSGLDKHWSPPTYEQRVNYRNLHPGAYTFSVLAINPDGTTSAKPATLSFVIPPPFWKTWWFGTIVGLTLAAAFGLVVRNAAQKKLKLKVEELERERAVQRERERISRDLHDHVGAQLVNIISGLDLVGKYSPPAERRAERLLQSLQQDARASMLQLRETIWALKGQAMAVEEFAEQVENYSRKQLQFHEGIELHFDAKCETSVALSPIQALNCFRIVQEALTNCVKHASAENIWVEVHSNARDGLCIAVKDDGVGLRDAPNGSTNGHLNGNGVLNMTRRAEEIGGKFNITQGNGRGTEVYVRISLQRLSSALQTL